MSDVCIMYGENEEVAPQLEKAIDDLKGISRERMIFPNIDHAVKAVASGTRALFFGFAPVRSLIRDRTIAPLNLHTSLRICDKITAVSEATGGIFAAQGNYDILPEFGRGFVDTFSYSELEIERNARIAFEYAEKEDKYILIVDRAKKLMTALLRRTIVADIHEDYPSVPLKVIDISEFSPSVDLEGSVIFGDALTCDVLTAAVGAKGFEAILGDSNVALYAPIGGEDGILKAPAHMLSYCFGREQ